MAQGDGAEGGSPLQSFASRVAVILGLDETQVQDAFSQAAGELQVDRLQLKLDRLVENGRLTQEEADEYKEWYLSRPDTALQGGHLRGFGGRGFFGGGFRSGHGSHGIRFQQESPPLEGSLVPSVEA